MSEIKLRRPIERWQNCDPNVMAMQSEAALRFAFSDMRHDILALHKELERLRAQVAELEDQKEAVIQQAQIWKQEARTMQNTVAECYQAVTGSTGEPGDWNGAKPVREAISELKGERDRSLSKVRELSSAMLSVNRSRHERIMINGDDQPCYWQREEWVKWIVELATRARDEA